MKVYNNITELIGKTPIIRLRKTEKELGLKGKLFVKVESFNPLSSVKDRIGFSMIEDLKKRGLIGKDTELIEPTSGNTGIALAYISAVNNIKLTITMPETMSKERIMVMRALGANVILTEGSLGMKGAINRAKELASKNPLAIIPSQFANPANPKIHMETTALEILSDMDNNVSYFISGVGTGGTITGVGKVLKEKIKDVKIIAVEPKDSQVLSGKEPGKHKIQGIGAGFIPEVLEMNLIDEIIAVTNDDAFKWSKYIAKNEGLLVGISSGAALDAAIKVAMREENTDKNIVVILPDTGERYLSTELYSEYV